MSLWPRFRRKEVLSSMGLGVQTARREETGLAGAVQTFGLGLLREECGQNPKKNVFLSPLSVFLALAMAENGARGETKVAMRKVLGMREDATEELVNEAVGALLRGVEARGRAELVIANALWADLRANISAEFTETCERVFEATARKLDFHARSAAGIINEWVREKTRGKIPSMVTAEGIAELPAILTNAIYFKGAFCVPFEKELTRPQTFYLVDGREKRVPMMHQSGLPGAYRCGEGFAAAALRYEDTGITLYMMLPDKGRRPEEVLTEAHVNELLTPKGNYELNLSMPKFTLDFCDVLGGPLARMGMGIAFQYPGADFSGTGSREFWLGQVVHKTRLEIDEEGTVAAAATAVECMSAMQPVRVPERSLVFDRPFAIVLRDTRTRTMLFAGVLYEPESGDL
jgi:serine protease inhibitor